MLRPSTPESATVPAPPRGAAAGVQVFEEGQLRLQLGIEAERRVSPVFGLLSDAGGGADQRVLGQTSIEW